MATVNPSAKATIKAFLDQYGLGSLADWAWGVFTGAGGDLSTGIATITAELPDQKAFQARFPAYQTLAKEGRAMSVQDMLNYEKTARQVFQANGIPQGFYDSPQELAKFMENDVSVSELEARVKDAAQATMAAPDVRHQLQTLYGVDQGHLTAFFLDPDKAEPIIAQKFTAAQIAAQAGRAGVGQLSADQATGLAQLGVNDNQAQSGFQQLGKEQGLFQAQTQGEQQVNLDTQLQAQFGGNAQAQLAFEQRAAARKAAFSGDSGFNASTTGVTGLAPQRTE